MGLKSRSPEPVEDPAEPTIYRRLTIGEVAEQAGIATSALRYYESVGLIPEPERESGQRRYDETVLGKLALIGVAKEAGFKLAEIRALIAELDTGRSLADSMRSISARKLAEVEAELERTRAVREWLDVASDCDCETPDECTLFPGGDDVSSAPAEALAVVRVAGGSCRRVDP